MLKFVVLVVAIASIAMTITRSKLFEEVRKWVQSKGKLVGYLVTCTWCTLHWLSLLAVIFFQPVSTEKIMILPKLAEIVAVMFVMVAASLPICLAMYFCIKLMKDVDYERAILKDEILREMAAAEAGQMTQATETPVSAT